MSSHEAARSEAAPSAAERFFRYFQHEVTALQEQMERLGSTALVGGERKDATDHCLAGITRLSSEVKDASGVLPAYDQRTYTEAVKALQEKLAETQAQHQPKQKFSFKTKKNASALSLHDAAQMAAEKQKSMLSFGNASGTSSSITTPVQYATPPNEIATSPPTSTQTVSTSDSTGTTTQIGPGTASLEVSTTRSTVSNDPASITSKSNIHIVLPASTSHVNTACTVSELDACCIDLSLPSMKAAPFASLTINKSKDSLLLCGAVTGPVHLTGVKNSTIVISCRQFRMHDCENIDVYLYCTSRPIIEDCSKIRFTEMPTFYADLLHSESLTSNEAIGSNMWEHVDDFKWLRPEQSPNWMILPATEQVPEATWRLLLPGKQGPRVDEILDLMSIRKRRQGRH